MRQGCLKRDRQQGSHAGRENSHSAAKKGPHLSSGYLAQIGKYEQSDGCRQPDLHIAPFINFRSKCVEGSAATFGNLAECLPELCFQRHAGPMAVECQGPLDWPRHFGSRRC